MNQQLFAGENERFLRRYEYDDSWVIAGDFGLDDGDVTVDIVDGTAIVVIETDDDVVETEFDLPGDDATVEYHNGVLTVTVAK